MEVLRSTFAFYAGCRIRDAMTSLEAKQQRNVTVMKKLLSKHPLRLRKISSGTIAEKLPKNGAFEQRNSAAVVLPN